MKHLETKKKQTGGCVELMCTGMSGKVEKKTKI